MVGCRGGQRKPRARRGSLGGIGEGGLAGASAIAAGIARLSAVMAAPDFGKLARHNAANVPQGRKTIIEREKAKQAGKHGTRSEGGIARLEV